MTRAFGASFAVAAALLESADARARRPLHADAWWAGLDRATEAAPARGVLALRAPPRGRVRIPAGRFMMGSTPMDMMRAIGQCHRELWRSACDTVGVGQSFRAEGIAHEVRLSTFMMDRTEVTVADYARCVSAGACAPPAFAPGDARFDRPSYPVSHVRWESAVAYCKWSGGRLPTEAEWEYAARGTTSREYPWGSLYNPHLANHGAFAADSTDATDGFLGLAPVGSFPDGMTSLGLLDMAGNVAEWVDEVYELDKDGFGYSADPQVDPQGKRIGTLHIVRGGSYEDGAPWLRGASRGQISSFYAATVGFRCAGDVS